MNSMFNNPLFARPDKPLRIETTQRKRVASPSIESMKKVVFLDKSTQCYVTPPEVARRMADYLNIEDNDHILEPEAGTGNLVNACINENTNITMTVIEKHHSLVDILASQFSNGNNINVHQMDFLDFIPNCQFHKIIMNPPFSRGDAKKHINHALGFLKRGGLLVALVPSTFSHDGAYEIELLDSGTFELTKVSTKIIEIRG